MLTAQNGKELSAEWQRERNRALKDSSSYTATELANLNVTIEGLGINDPDTYKIDTTPLDSNTTPKSNKIDIRNRPECGS